MLTPGPSSCVGHLFRVCCGILWSAFTRARPQADTVSWMDSGRFLRGPENTFGEVEQSVSSVGDPWA